MRHRIFLSALACVALWIGSARAQSPFYQDKTITIVVGFIPGDVYDLFARLIAQYIPRYIPGSPNAIVQNMPGAGSLVAANHLYTVAKPDGLTLGAISPALYFDQLIGRKEVRFDWAKFAWLGTPTLTNRLLYMRSDAPYRSIHDVLKSKEPPKCGATGTGTSEYYVPRLLEESLGAKFNMVTGYPGGGDVDLAVERGEIECRAFSIQAYFAREPFHTWRKTGFVRVLVQTGLRRDPRLPDVPTIYELMDQYQTPEASRRLAKVVMASDSFGRPIVAGPGLPPERAKILREAFGKTVKDPDFLAEAKKKKLEADPATGEELEALAKEVIVQPPEVIERMRKLLGK